MAKLPEDTGQPGLKRKYDIRKANGDPVDAEGIYFVLKLNSKHKGHAEACRVAASVYSIAIERYFPELAEDLEVLVKDLRKEAKLRKADNE